ncbi:hypothetical protein K438DRAFT_866565 [Mycena galopus ATCC 62051]|nr:hypothetical protein K438DRAFT_866565 [Mycena galopus ATCC 62051]
MLWAGLKSKLDYWRPIFKFFRRVCADVIWPPGGHVDSESDSYTVGHVPLAGFPVRTETSVVLCAVHQDADEPVQLTLHSALPASYCALRNNEAREFPPPTGRASRFPVLPA